MAIMECCICGKTLQPQEQCARVTEKIVKQIESANPGLYLSSYYGIDPNGNKSWIVCLDCVNKYLS